MTFKFSSFPLTNLTNRTRCVRRLHSPLMPVLPSIMSSTATHTHTFVLSAPKSTQWDQSAHPCLSYSDTGEVACLSGPVLSGAVRWTWDKCILNPNQISPARHLRSVILRQEKWANVPALWRRPKHPIFCVLLFFFSLNYVLLSGF